MQSTHGCVNRLLPQHLKDLRKSGLSDDMIAAMRCRSVTAPQVVALQLHWFNLPQFKRGPVDLNLLLPQAAALGPCLEIPYLWDDGEPSGYARLKPDVPRMDRKRPDRPIKYESPIGEPPQLYVPPGMWDYIYAGDGPFLLVEGEKKAAKAVEDGFPAVGIAGVWAWCRKREDKESFRQLLPGLEAIPCRGEKCRRLIVPIFDSDYYGNDGIQYALAELRACLERKGWVARPFIVPPHGPKKQGLDDALIQEGADWLRHELRRKVGFGCPVESHIYNVRYNEIRRDIPPPSDPPIQLVAAALARAKEAEFKLKWFGHGVCPSQRMPLLRERDEEVEFKQRFGDGSECVQARKFRVTCRMNKCPECFPRNQKLYASQVISPESPLRFEHLPATLTANGGGLFTLTIGNEAIQGGQIDSLADKAIDAIRRTIRERRLTVVEDVINAARSRVLGLRPMDKKAAPIYLPFALRTGTLYALELPLNEWQARQVALRKHINRNGDGHSLVESVDGVYLVTDAPLDGANKMSVDQACAATSAAIYAVPFQSDAKKRIRFYSTSRSWQPPARASRWKFIAATMSHVKEDWVREQLANAGLEYMEKIYSDDKPHKFDPHIVTRMAIAFPLNWSVEEIDGFLKHLAIGEPYPSVYDEQPEADLQ